MKKLFSVLLFMNTILWAQAYDCKIYHTNGTTYSLNIISIQSLGLIDSSNAHISYKHIDSLITNSDELIKILKKNQEVISLKKRDNKYLVVFNKAIFKLTSTPLEFMYDFRTNISLSTMTYNYLSLQIQYKFGFCPSLLQKLIFSSGNTFANPNFYSLNVGYGTGIKLPISELNFEVWLNFTESTLFKNYQNGGSSFEDRFILFIDGLNYFSLSKDESFQLGVGFSYYLTQFMVNKNTQRFVFKISLSMLK
ncbi:MAG: hypothetical protein GY936_00095 [Ignavibacteriae bacterium]|nr:hypothetical protein [Ignavibacteriota bacterium]